MLNQTERQLEYISTTQLAPMNVKKLVEHPFDLYEEFRDFDVRVGADADLQAKLVITCDY
jgi:hypothetical protein